MILFSISSITLLSGFIIGYFYSNYSANLTLKNEKMKLVLDKNKQFNQILEKSKTKRTRFKTRINNTVYIGVKLDDYGKVDILYFLDRSDIVIYKGDKCLFTSEDVEKSLLDEVINSLYKIHHYRINDVVEILGFVFYREDFEKNFNINIEDLKEKTENILKMNQDDSDVNKIINKNDQKFDIDEILDKINEVGIENLTKEELDFLNSQNK